MTQYSPACPGGSWRVELLASCLCPDTRAAAGEGNGQWSMVNGQHNTVIIMATTEEHLVTRTVPITH